MLNIAELVKTYPYDEWKDWATFALFSGDRQTMIDRAVELEKLIEESFPNGCMRPHVLSWLPELDQLYRRLLKPFGPPKPPNPTPEELIGYRVRFDRYSDNEIGTGLVIRRSEDRPGYVVIKVNDKPFARYHRHPQDVEIIEEQTVAECTDEVAAPEIVDEETMTAPEPVAVEEGKEKDATN